MLATGAAAVLAPKGQAQSKKAGASPAADAELKALEARLEKPLPAKLKSPAQAALRQVRTAAAERLKFRLPEGSEPCTVFIPSSAGRQTL